jgi:ABC-type transport system involved in cytochrome c biogenesis permease subunit
MDNLETISLVLSIAGVILSIAFFLLSFIKKRKQAASEDTVSGKSGLDMAANIAVIITILLVTVAIIGRAIETGHGPFSNMYEFALAFSWGIILAGFIFHLRYKTGAILNISLIIALLLLIFARVQYAPPQLPYPRPAAKCTAFSPRCFGSGCLRHTYHRFRSRNPLPGTE